MTISIRQIEKSTDVLGNRTRSRGADNTTELRRPPFLNIVMVG